MKTKLETAMFVDPGSHCAGYAIFTTDGELLKSGAVKAYGDKIVERLTQVSGAFAALSREYAPTFAVLERLNYKVDFRLHWAVGGILVGISAPGGLLDVRFQTPGEWTQYAKLQGVDFYPKGTPKEKKDLKDLQARLGAWTGDEAVALTMGYRHFALALPDRRKA